MLDLNKHTNLYNDICANIIIAKQNEKSKTFKNDCIFSESMQPLTDEILKDSFNKILKYENIKITRLKDEKGQVHLLDKNFAIDGIIELESGMIFTFQEKIRRHKNKEFNDFTLEYLSNINKNIKGEFFHLCSDFYIHGYANEGEKEIDTLRIIKVINLKEYINKNIIDLKKEMQKNKNHSNASFLPIDFEELDKEKDIVIYKYQNEKTLETKIKL